MVHSRVKKQKEVRTNFNGSARRLRLIHQFRRCNTTASIRGGPITLLQDEDRPDFPPDVSRVDTGIVHNMAMVWRRYEDGCVWSSREAERIQRHYLNSVTLQDVLPTRQQLRRVQSEAP